MSMEMPTPFRPVNNDRMAAVTAFRPAVPTQTMAQPVVDTHSHVNAIASSAATALPSIPAPRPAHLDDTQASGILGALQQEDQGELLQVHSGLDADRVARLLSLLD